MRRATPMLENINGDCIISKKEAAELLDISVDTLDRMTARGEGPKRVQLSARRVGFQMRELRQWIERRAEAEE